MTVPSFVASTGVAQEVANPSLTIPGGISTGNLMVLMCCSINGGVMTTPSGWTFERADAAATVNEDLLIAVFWRYATSGDPGSTLSLTINGRCAALLAAYSGVRVSPPVAGSAAGAGSFPVTEANVHGGWSGGAQTNNATLTAPGATADSSDTRIVRLWLGGVDATNRDPILTLPSTSRQNNPGHFLAAGISDESLTGAGPASSNTATNSITGDWVAATILIGSQSVPTGQLSSGLVVRRHI